MRMPSIPLITVDPYFSVWSPYETLNYMETVHWTGKANPITGSVIVDGQELLFLGMEIKLRRITQVSLEVSAMVTKAVYRNEKIELTAEFMTPLFLDNPKLLSRPVSYLALSYKSLDGKKHKVRAKVVVRKDICLDDRSQNAVEFENVDIEGVPTIKMGNVEQKVLWRSGDNVRIDWGYFYLSVADPKAEVRACKARWDYAYSEAPMREGKDELFLFSYDDIYSINYFGKNLKSAWNNDGTTIKEAIKNAAGEYKKLHKKAVEFSADLYERAKKAGGKKYAELVSGAYRQVIGAHKVAIDENGEMLFISKECFSNGCASTVDVSYPSIPLFLVYNAEFVKGMLRQVYKFVSTDKWKFDFAPHDVGQYPLLNGQVYGLNRETNELSINSQMPVEESGNMIIMETCIAIAQNDASFAAKHMDTLTKWCEYLIKYGVDPENQLCTDDFAGHMAHNCNLALKAIIGVKGMSILLEMLGKKEESEKYGKEAERMAKLWLKNARNDDGTFRLAFDQPGTYSQKYNMVWDKIWNTKLFDKKSVDIESKSYLGKMNKYGLPLDSRAYYVKSDWLVWTATLCSEKSDFEKLVAPLWQAYNDSPSRVPMTDFFDTENAIQIAMQHRTVQGGLFIKLLESEKSLQYKKR